MRRRPRKTSAWSKPGFAPGGIAMKPTLARLTSVAFAGACDLVLAPGVERVVDRQRELELAVVTEVQEMEPLSDGEQAARLRRRVAIVGDIGAVHDPRQQLQRQVVELVLLDQHLERAEPVAVRVLSIGRVVRVCVLQLGDLEHLVGGHVEELRLGVDEVLDQPRAGDPVGLRPFACDPLHGRSPFVQWRASPAAAAAATSAGSGTLIRFCSSNASATTPIAAASQPWIVWRPITIAAPAIAPAAAAVAPLTNPCRRGWRSKRRNSRPGTTTNR